MVIVINGFLYYASRISIDPVEGFFMQETLGPHDLQDTISSSGRMTRSDQSPGTANSLAARAARIHRNKTCQEQQPETDLNESLFSQLFERIVQGYALRLEDEGEESSDSLEILLDGVPYSVLIMSTAGKIREANQAFFSTFGYAREDLIGTPIYDLLPECYRAAFHERLARFSMRSDTPRQAVPDDILAFRGQRQDGVVVSMDCLLSSIQLKDEAAVIALIRDLSFDHTLFLQLNETKEHYVALSETITEAIFRLDDEFRIIFANTGVKNTFGWEREEVVGKPFRVLFPQEVFAKHETEFKKYFFVDDQDRVANGLKRTIEFLGATKHRGVAPMEMSFGNSKDYKGRTLTCVIRDITQRKAMERKLRHLAFHDKLTGLGNRDLFNEDMAGILRKIQSDPDWHGSVMFLDLDGFKHINDTLGHDSGDELLVETARRIRVCLRELDVAYRFGGDEFVVILATIKGVEDSAIVAERILASVSNPYILRGGSKKSGKRVNVGVSIGVAVVPDHGRTLEEVTKSADIAMYCSKEAGRNRYTVYDPGISARATLRWQMEQEMKTALGNGGFRLLYQPLVGIDGRVRGMEALLRWSRLDGEVVSPGVFIPIAEENGLIVALGDWVLRRACYDAQRLSELGHPDIYVSVNVSNRQFDQPNYVDELENIVRSSGLTPSRLKLEITESTIMKNTDDAIERIKEIKQRLPGICFMVDDFGTGYSSLAYLSRLPVDFLKIDISFVMNLAEQQNEKVVNAIINLGHSLDLGIVAEGIETKAQWAYFAERECSALQGYYFLRPSTLEEIHALIDRGHGQAVPAGTSQ
jgi:diguanylate cyclase (GGDEF)-like protein/PAS domain S-box-containing protein